MQFDKNCFVYLFLNVFLFPNQYVHCFYCSASASSLIDLPAAFLATLVQLKTFASCQTHEQLFFNPIKTFMNFSIIDCEWPVVV